MADIQIRDADSSDLPQLCELLAQLGEDPPMVPGRAEQAALAAMLTLPGLTLLVAEQDARLVGTITLVVVPNLTHGSRPWAQLENMVVDRSRRSTGVGRGLMDQALAIAREAGRYKMQLQSANARAGAHRFYEREGFSPSSKGYRRYLE